VGCRKLVPLEGRGPTRGVVLGSPDVVNVVLMLLKPSHRGTLPQVERRCTREVPAARAAFARRGARPGRSARASRTAPRGARAGSRPCARTLASAAPPSALAPPLRARPFPTSPRAPRSITWGHSWYGPAPSRRTSMQFLARWAPRACAGRRARIGAAGARNGPGRARGSGAPDGIRTHDIQLGKPSAVGRKSGTQAGLAILRMALVTETAPSWPDR
jgi:hypothetical protein